MPLPSGNTLTLALNVRRTTVVLAAIVFGLALAHGIVHLLDVFPGGGSECGAVIKRFFDMGSEANLPTFVSALNLLFAGSLFALVAYHESLHKGERVYCWWGLALGFTIMGFDEAAQIHEGLVGQLLVVAFGRGDGLLHYRWYLLFIPLVSVLAVLYLPFIRNLPKPYAWRFFLAGTVYLSGAIGFEMVEALLVSNGLPGRSFTRLFEESAEMLGVVLAIHALLLYMAEKGITVRFSCRTETSSVSLQRSVQE